MPRPLADRFLSRQILFWLLLYCALWWLLAGGGGWYLGAPCIVAAAMLSCWLGTPAWRLRPAAAPRFLWFFLRALVAGGWDVARRAIQPRMPLAPAWVHYPLNIRQPRSRLLFASLVGLLPGTLAAAIEDDCLSMHVLDQHQPWQQNTAQLERQLLRLLGEEPT